jgi:conjugative transposon TraJ protein
MKKRVWVIVGGLFCFVLAPGLASAQDGTYYRATGGFQDLLENVYNAMIGNCSELIGVGRGLAGFAAMWYIGVRVWGHMARAEPIDVYPLLRPFLVGGAISLFPFVIGVTNGVMQPTVAGTAALVKNSNEALANLLAAREQALEQSADWQMFVGPSGSGDEQKWEQLSGEADSGVFSGLANGVKFQLAKAAYNLKNTVKVWLSEVLQLLFEAVAVSINTVRTFYLLILAIVGPLAFGLSVFDGFHHTLAHWLAKYINVFLWLPVANIFGSLIAQVQQQMTQLDINQLEASGQTTFGPTDAAYLIFLVLAIVGYCTVPSIANYIVHAGGLTTHWRKTEQVVRSVAGV